MTFTMPLIGAAPGARSSRVDQGVAAAAVAIVFVSYGGKSAHFYAYWAIGAVVVVLGTLIVLLQARVGLSYLAVLAKVAGWTVVTLALTPVVHNQEIHIKAISLSLFCAFVAITLANCSVTDIRRLSGLLGAWVFIWLVVNGLLVCGYLIGLIQYDDGVFAGPYGNRNLYAVTTLFLLASWLSMSGSVREHYGRLIYPCVSIALASMVLATASTKGLVGLLAIVLVKTWLSGQRRNLLRVMLAVMGVLLLGALVGGASLIERAVEKFEAITSAEGRADVRISSSSFKRVELLLQSAELISQRPWTGVGVDNSRFFLFTQSYIVKVQKGDIEPGETGAYSHSNYTEMLLNGGVLAFLAYYLPLLALIAGAIRRRSAPPEGRLLIVSLVVLKLVLDLGMVSYRDFSHVFFMALCWFVYARVLRSGVAGEQDGVGRLSVRTS